MARAPTVPVLIVPMRTQVRLIPRPRIVQPELYQRQPLVPIRRTRVLLSPTREFLPSRYRETAILILYQAIRHQLSQLTVDPVTAGLVTVVPVIADLVTADPAILTLHPETLARQ